MQEFWIFSTKLFLELFKMIYHFKNAESVHQELVNPHARGHLQTKLIPHTLELEQMLQKYDSSTVFTIGFRMTDGKL